MDATSHSLDRIDHEILAALSENARLSNKELAAHVGLAPSSCLERVRRLLRDGVIQGFHARVDPSALGIALEALVFVRMARHQREAMAGVWEHLMELPEVSDLYYVAGSHDLVVHVAVADVEHLRRLVSDQISSHAEIGQLETSLIFKHHRSARLPDYAMPAKAQPEPARNRRAQGRTRR